PDLTDLGNQLTILERNFDDVLIERQTLRDENKKLSSKIAIFTQGSYFPSLLRNGFLSTFKHDKLNLGLTPPEEDNISDGHAWTHEGNILADCELYTKRMRDDYCVFERLYGMPPHAVPALIKDTATIKLLNAHATALASGDRKCSPVLGEAVTRFMVDLRAASYPGGYLSGKTEDPAILKLRGSYRACEDALADYMD
ncbi:hypothetical protein BBP40_001827, partial [Aspergillus hancockii]